jgi:hypothetical protein
MAARCDELGALLGAALRLCGRTLDGSMTCGVQRSAAHAPRTAARSAEPGRRAQGCGQGVGARGGRAAQRGGAGAAAGAGAAVQRAAGSELHARAYRRSQRPAGSTPHLLSLHERVVSAGGLRITQGKHEAGCTPSVLLAGVRLSWCALGTELGAVCDSGTTTAQAARWWS